MRSIIAAFLAAGAAVADDPFISGDALRKDIERCAGGCIVFDRAQAEALESAMQQFASQAYLAGRNEGKCRL